MSQEETNAESAAKWAWLAKQHAEALASSPSAVDRLEARLRRIEARLAALEAALSEKEYVEQANANRRRRLAGRAQQRWEPPWREP